MKSLFLPLSLLISFNLKCQPNLTGKYKDYFGNRIELNVDSTFRYNWNFDMLSRWSIGKWRINGDTLLLRVIPVYDTLKMTNVKHELADTLILSDDETSERVEIEQMIKTGISARVQTITDYPSMLIYRKGRFYKIRKGRLVTKKEKGFWSKKKWSPWYFKSDE